MRWGRVGAGVTSASGFGLAWALDHMWTDPEPWVVHLVLAISASLMFFALFAGLIRWGARAMAGRSDETKEGDQPTTVEIHKSPAGRDINVNINQANNPGEVYRGIHFDKVGQVIINQVPNAPNKKTATIITTEASAAVDKAFIDFKPREMFETGSSASLVASANVSSISSTASAGSTEFTLIFQNPLDGTKFNVMTHGGTSKIIVTDVSSGAATFNVEGETPQKISFRIETSKDKK